MDILGQSALWVSVTSFTFGFSVLARNVRNILFLSFASMGVLISGWSLSFFLERIWPGLGFYRLHLLFNVFLGPVCLYFIRVMVRMQDGVSRRLLDLSLILAILLSFALLLRWDSSPWVLQWIYFSPVLIVLQTLRLMGLNRGLKKGGRKQRIPQKAIRQIPIKLLRLPTVGVGRQNLIYSGALIVLVTSVMDHVPWMGLAWPSFGNLALIVYLFFLSQAITQQRLLNISALFSRFLVLLVVAFTLAIVYALLVSWVENSPGLFFLNSFIASFLILMLLDPLRSLVGYFTQRLLTQKHRRLQQTLRDAQRKLTGVVDLGALFQTVLAVVEQTLSPEWAALFVLRSDGTQYRRVRTLKRDPNIEVVSASYLSFKEVLANHSILQHCANLARKGKFPVLLDQILENEMDRSASRVQRQHLSLLIEGLKGLGGNLLIPLFDSGRILGFVILWVPSPPEPWGNNWGLLPIIYPFFEQSARALQSMEVYAKQREQERLAALGEMAAGLAHEIRNPLGAIKGAAQYLDPSADRPESRFLKVILEEVDRLNRVVTQFLDYSKPPATDLRPVDLSKLAEKTIELMKPGLLQVELEFHPSRLPARVMASPEQIRQVLINLIQNSQNALIQPPSQDAAEGVAHEAGMIRVTVTVDGDSQSSEVRLSVEDTGHGIKKENLEKLFIPFFTTSPAGTGLGLSISHKIIEAHRGRIEVVSEEGVFTRVSVILPYLKE